MRVALISLLGVAGAGQAAEEFPGFLPIGGRSLARHQLGLALALGCTRVVIEAESLSAEVYGLQQLAQSRGARLHVIASAHALVPLVAPEDELIAFTAGLLVDPAAAQALIDGPAGVIAVPVDWGLAAGFARLDPNHAGGGLLKVSGRLVAQLGDYPADSDPHLLLRHLASQAHQPLRMVPDTVIARGGWRLVRSEAEAAQAEAQWLREVTETAVTRGPSPLLAVVLLRQIGPSLLHAHTRPALIALGALLVVLLGFGASWWGYIGLGFVLFALGTLVIAVAHELARIERDSLLEPDAKVHGSAALSVLIDAGLVFACVGASASLRLGAHGAPNLAAPSLAAPDFTIAFAPLVLVLQFRVYPHLLDRARWVRWLSDRLVAALALAGLGLLVPLASALQVAVVAWLVAAWVDVGWGDKFGQFSQRLRNTRA